MKRLALVVFAGLAAMCAASAQESSHLALSIGGGFTDPVGGTSRRLDNGWNLQAGAGVNFSPYIGAMIDLGYNRFGINSATLNNLGFPDGALHVLSATLDPIIHVNPHGHVDLYLIGGGGLYHRYQEFTRPTTQAVTGYDPFFGFYTALFPANQVLASYSTNTLGFNGGAGIAFGTKRHIKIFAEARYNRIFMGHDRYTDYMPVTFGFRW